MYLRGSKWSMKRRRGRKVNFWLISIVIVLIGMFAYVDLVIVPTTPPLFISTPTPTRDPRAYAQDAASFFAQGKINQAIDAYKQATIADPQNPSNYLELARLQVFGGKYKDAQVNAENAILLDKNSALANAVHGWALGQQSEWLLSEGAFTRALTLDPNLALTHAYYAEILALQVQAGKGELSTQDKAIEESRKAIALDPKLLESHRARGIVLEITGNNAEAVQEFQSAIQINENIADLHIALGRNLIFVEKYSEAVDEFIRANTLNPSDPLPSLYISRTYARIGEWAKAVQYGKEAVKSDPSDPTLHGNYGSMLYKTEEYGQAVTELRLAIRGGTAEDGSVVKGIPLSNELRTLEFFYRYGLSLARLNQCNEAVQIAQLILQTIKGDETATYNANAMIQICQETLTGTATPTPAVKATPTPKK